MLSLLLKFQTDPAPTGALGQRDALVWLHVTWDTCWEEVLARHQGLSCPASEGQPLEGQARGVLSLGPHSNPVSFHPHLTQGEATAQRRYVTRPMPQSL